MALRPPAFQFYAKDWMSSHSVSQMTMHERGIYISLLAAAWESPEPGTLPLPVESTARASGIDVRSLRCFLARWATVQIEDHGEIAERSPRDRGDVSSRSTGSWSTKNYAKTGLTTNKSVRSGERQQSAGMLQMQSKCTTLHLLLHLHLRTKEKKNHPLPPPRGCLKFPPGFLLKLGTGLWKCGERSGHHLPSTRRNSR